MRSRLPDFREQVLSNGSYKIVALLAALVLWLSVLGRKDVVTSRDVNLEYLLKPEHSLTGNVDQNVQIQVSGPRLALKKFMQGNEPMIINLNNKEPGVYTVNISKQAAMELPLGVKVLSVRPKVIRVQITK